MLDGDERLNIKQLNEKVDILARHPLNGRQIRNVINNARHLARFKERVLAYSHICETLDIATEFEEYLTRTRGHTDEEYAKAEGIRG